MSLPWMSKFHGDALAVVDRSREARPWLEIHHRVVFQHEAGVEVQLDGAQA